MNNNDYMLIIPTKCLIEDNAAAPEGTVIIECKKCGRKFAIPTTTNPTVNQADACCEDCIAAENINTMKNDNSEANATINAALGQ